MPTILLVEDDRMITAMLTEFLQLEGYTVLPAAHGGEGLTQLQHHTVDLVLSDVHMPELNGVAFYEHLRADPTYRVQPFIFMSALRPPDLTTADPYLAFLPKPLDLATLLSTIARMIEQQQAAIEHESP